MKKVQKNPFFSISSYDPTAEYIKSKKGAINQRHVFTNIHHSKYPYKLMMCTDIKDDTLETFFLIPILYTTKGLTNLNMLKSSHNYIGMPLSQIEKLLGRPIFHYVYGNGSVLMVFADEHHCLNGVRAVMALVKIDANLQCEWLLVPHFDVCTKCFDHNFILQSQTNDNARILKYNALEKRKINSLIQNKTLFFFSKGKYNNVAQILWPLSEFFSKIPCGNIHDHNVTRMVWKYYSSQNAENLRIAKGVARWITKNIDTKDLLNSLHSHGKNFKITDVAMVIMSQIYYDKNLLRTKIRNRIKNLRIKEEQEKKAILGQK